MNKLLVIRFSAIGDVALSVLAVRALREAYPDLDITVVTREHLLCLFEDIPNLSFFMVPHHPEWEDRLELIRQLQGNKFDAVADLQNTFTSRTLCRVIACKGSRVERFDRCRKPLRKLTKHRPGAEPVREEVLRFLDVFARLGYPVNPPVVKRKTLPVPEVFGPKAGRWVGLAPFTTKLTKMYPLDSAAEVVRRLHDEFDKVFIFSGAHFQPGCAGVRRRGDHAHGPAHGRAHRGALGRNASGLRLRSLWGRSQAGLSAAGPALPAVLGLRGGLLPPGRLCLPEPPDTGHDSGQGA